MRVGGALLVAVRQTALQRGPAGGIERDRVRPVPEQASLGVVIDVVDLQQPGLLAGGSVQQGEHPDEGFVRVNVGVGGPATKQFALLIEGEGAAAERVGTVGG
ncbi:hypothetical protein [Sciscionella marina]|uniref:hypothetical protein n=1 Tax=Sciscionella marina TaxID=508770 RepID=UPI00196A00DB|nr:hypothetical protein [Sciscionella marina]